MDQVVELLGPEHVLGLGPGQVVREEPRPDSADVEDNYFPFVELATADLPWLLTPAAPDAQGRLRPWLVLVVVREQEGVSLTTRGATALPVLRIEDPAVPAAELPDLADSWAWAHVQSLVPAADVEAAVAAGTGEVVARIVCPRRLVPRAAWRACLVPAFAGGVARGLGAEAAGNALAPAWVQPGEPHRAARVPLVALHDRRGRATSRRSAGACSPTATAPTWDVTRWRSATRAS